MQKEGQKGEGRKKKTDMLQGMLDLLILRTLRQGPLKGWDIMNHIQTCSGRALSRDSRRSERARRRGIPDHRALRALDADPGETSKRGRSRIYIESRLRRKAGQQGVSKGVLYAG
jgi:hypothetical protein